MIVAAACCLGGPILLGGVGFATIAWGRGIAVAIGVVALVAALWLVVRRRD